jgi:signal transduction histidine kinase
MRRQAAEISAHDAASRLQVPRTRDELAALATTMNELLTRLHDASARQRAFVADAGHELRTPLAVLRTELELANRPQRDEAELRDALEHVAAGVDRLADLTADLLLLARADEAIEPRFETVRVAGVLEAAVATATEGAGHPVATVAVDVPTDLEVRAVPSLLYRAVENVLENALHYAPVASPVTVRGSRSGAEVAIEVADCGPGFPTEFLPFAFERFRRADDARSRAEGGTGLGLAIVRSIAELHGGAATARNAADGGAVVTFSIVDSKAPPTV